MQKYISYLNKMAIPLVTTNSLTHQFGYSQWSKNITTINQPAVECRLIFQSDDAVIIRESRWTLDLADN